MLANIPAAFFAFRTSKLADEICVGLYFASDPRDRSAMNFHAKNPGAFGNTWRFEPYY